MERYIGRIEELIITVLIEVQLKIVLGVAFLFELSDEKFLSLVSMLVKKAAKNPHIIALCYAFYVRHGVFTAHWYTVTSHPLYIAWKQEVAQVIYRIMEDDPQMQDALRVLQTGHSGSITGEWKRWSRKFGLDWSEAKKENNAELQKLCKMINKGLRQPPWRNDMGLRQPPWRKN